MDKLRLTTYLACAIEHNTEDPEAHTWKVRIKEALERPDVGVYDPIEQEEAKTGKPFKEACEYINKLKRGGVWEIFHEVMRRIWWGITKPAVGNKIRMLLMFKDRACIDGNSKIDFPVWGDYEAVARSNFIIVYLQKEVKTVGTLFEVHTAYLLDIPIYLILPDQSKTDANSTLLEAVRESGGEIFYSVNDCVNHIKETHKIK